MKDLGKINQYLGIKNIEYNENKQETQPHMI